VTLERPKATWVAAACVAAVCALCDVAGAADGPPAAPPAPPEKVNAGAEEWLERARRADARLRADEAVEAWLAHARLARGTASAGRALLEAGRLLGEMDERARAIEVLEQAGRETSDGAIVAEALGAAAAMYRAAADRSGEKAALELLVEKAGPEPGLRDAVAVAEWRLAELAREAGDTPRFERRRDSVVKRWQAAGSPVGTALGRAAAWARLSQLQQAAEAIEARGVVFDKNAFRKPKPGLPPPPDPMIALNAYVQAVRKTRDDMDALSRLGVPAVNLEAAALGAAFGARAAEVVRATGDRMPVPDRFAPLVAAECRDIANRLRAESGDWLQRAVHAARAQRATGRSVLRLRATVQALRPDLLPLLPETGAGVPVVPLVPSARLAWPTAAILRKPPPGEADPAASRVFGEGVSALDAQQPQLARVRFEEALIRRPSLASARANLALTFLRLGQLDTAARLARAGLAIPGSVPIVGPLVAVLVRAWGPSGALGALDLQWDGRAEPRPDAVERVRERLLIAEGRATDAIGSALAALSRDEKDTAALRTLSLALPRSARPGLSARALRRAEAQDFADAQAGAKTGRDPAFIDLALAEDLYLAARALLARGDVTESLGRFDKAIRLAPDDPRVASDRAAALLLAGDPRSAAEAARVAIGADPGTAEAHAIAALAYVALGDSLAAWTSFHKALTLDEGLVEAHRGLGLLLAAGPLVGLDEVSRLTLALRHLSAARRARGLDSEIDRALETVRAALGTLPPPP